jgi:hypothetical protein
MPFIQTCLAQSPSASPKATTLYVYKMSLFLVECLLNRWHRASTPRIRITSLSTHSMIEKVEKLFNKFIPDIHSDLLSKTYLLGNSVST